MSDGWRDLIAKDSSDARYDLFYMFSKVHCYTRRVLKGTSRFESAAL